MKFKQKTIYWVSYFVLMAFGMVFTVPVAIIAYTQKDWSLIFDSKFIWTLLIVWALFSLFEWIVKRDIDNAVGSGGYSRKELREFDADMRKRKRREWLWKSFWRLFK